MRNILKKMLCVAAVACLMLSVTAQADGKKLQADLSVAQEALPTVPGLIQSATITAKFKKDLSEVEVKFSVKGGGNVGAAHFHCARAGSNGPVAVTLFSGMLGPLPFDGAHASGTLTNADVLMNSCMVVIGRPVNNIASLMFAMLDGLIYVNVHTMENPGGEVRGQMLE